eukprot:Amastigsp_a175591_426.p2 type:complete len:142 gc:universal Amastigsp_a175591_426:559-134(-)
MRDDGAGAGLARRGLAVAADRGRVRVQLWVPDLCRLSRVAHRCREPGLLAGERPATAGHDHNLLRHRRRARADALQGRSRRLYRVVQGVRRRRQGDRGHVCSREARQGRQRRRRRRSRHVGPGHHAAQGRRRAAERPRLGL